MSRAGKMLAELSGQERVLVIRRPLVEWLGGDLYAAMLLDQAMHWSSTKTARSRGGWFYKSDDEWASEFYTTVYQIRKARKTLADEGLLHAERRGHPARMWYMCDVDHVADLFMTWLADEGEREAQLCEIEDPVVRNRITSSAKSHDIQKNTQKNTSEVRDVAPAGANPAPKKPTLQQAMFGAVADACGYDLSLLSSEKKIAVGKLATEFRKAGISPEFVAECGRRWPSQFPNRAPADITPPLPRQLKDWVGQCRRAGVAVSAPIPPSLRRFFTDDGRLKAIGAVVYEFGLEGIDQADPSTWPDDYMQARAAYAEARRG